MLIVMVSLASGHLLNSLPHVAALWQSSVVGDYAASFNEGNRWFSTLQLGQQGIEKGRPVDCDRRRVEDPLTQGLLASKSDEPKAFEQTLVPKRGLPDGNLSQGLFEVIGPHRAILPAAISDGVEQDDVPNHDLRAQLLDIRDFPHVVIEPVRDCALGVFPNRLQRD
jgi:hypothetical protein